MLLTTEHSRRFSAYETYSIRVQFHRAVGLEKIKFKRLFNIDEGDAATSKQWLRLVEGPAEVFISGTARVPQR
jgi:hypothetical protein